MGSEISKKDITRLGFRSSLLQASFNYERMQAGGFTWAMLPILKKIYKDDKPGLSAAMKDNLEFINTHPNLVGFLMGLLISMEEKGENRDTIKGLKVALFGPIAGIGDAILWRGFAHRLPVRETCWGRFYFSPFTCLSFSCASAGPTSVIQSA
jgi:PTS system galactosamine-specific IID component